MASRIQLEARVKFYNFDKGFGFASDGIQRIFFHQSDCRVVEGTPEKPVLTDKPSNDIPLWTPTLRRPSTLLMRMTRTPKGLKAVEWGIVRQPTWLEILHKNGKLNGYVGGKVTVIRAIPGQGISTRRGTLLEAPQLTPGEPWQLSLVFNEADTERTPAGRTSMTLELHCSHGNNSLPCGRYAIEYHDYEEYQPGARVQVTFYPPSER